MKLKRKILCNFNAGRSCSGLAVKSEQRKQAVKKRIDKRFMRILGAEKRERLMRLTRWQNDKIDLNAPRWLKMLVRTERWAVKVSGRAIGSWIVWISDLAVNAKEIIRYSERRIRMQSCCGMFRNWNCSAAERGRKRRAVCSSVRAFQSQRNAEHANFVISLFSKCVDSILESRCYSKFETTNVNECKYFTMQIRTEMFNSSAW